MFEIIQKENVYCTRYLRENNTETPQNISHKKTVEKILAAIINNPQITQVELAKMSGLTRRGVEYNLSKLKEKELIVREGSDKGGYWKVLKYGINTARS